LQVLKNAWPSIPRLNKVPGPSGSGQAHLLQSCSEAGDCRLAPPEAPAAGAARGIRLRANCDMRAAAADNAAAAIMPLRAIASSLLRPGRPAYGRSPFVWAILNEREGLDLTYINPRRDRTPRRRRRIRAAGRKRQRQFTRKLRNCHGSEGSMSSGYRLPRPASGVQSVYAPTSFPR